MKTIGWICFIIGIVSFLGAASKGHNVFGPSFWIALGGFLLYRASNKGKEKDDQTVESKYVRQSLPKNESPMSNNSDCITKKASIPQKESLSEIQSQLTIQQREAAMCLISFFAGFNNNLTDDVPILIFKQSATFFGFPDSPIVLSQMMSRYTDSDTLIDMVITIKSTKAKEFLLLTCYDLIKSIDNSNAKNILFNIANEMGYDKIMMHKLIKQYS